MTERSGTQKKGMNGLDASLKRLSTISSRTAFISATCLAAIGAVLAISPTSETHLASMASIILALLAAVLGINAIFREMKMLKIVEADSVFARLTSMCHNDFERYIRALFGLQGYLVEKAPIHLMKNGGAELQATLKKKLTLIQIGHWDDDEVGIREVQSLYQAGALAEAAEVICITLGRFSNDAQAWAARRNVRLINREQLLILAAEIMQVDPSSLTPVEPAEMAEEISHEITDLAQGHHRYMFVDFAGIQHGLPMFEKLMLAHPAFSIVPSTLPAGLSLQDLREMVGQCANRLLEPLPENSAGRYFAIQSYVSRHEKPQDATWIALDSNPRAFPEGVSEVVIINPAFGFDHSAFNRLEDAILLSDARKESKTARNGAIATPFGS